MGHDTLKRGPSFASRLRRASKTQASPQVRCPGFSRGELRLNPLAAGWQAGLVWLAMTGDSVPEFGMPHRITAADV
jgi:hypothetical protein